MFWKILTFLSVVLGASAGYITYEKKTVEIKKKIVPKDCEIHKKDHLFEDDMKKRCVTRFTNRGDSFELKRESIQGKIFNLFKKDFKALEKYPDEYNIYIAKEGKRAVPYDPRLAHFLRFKVNKFVLDNTEISNFSVVTKDTTDVMSSLKNLACREPQFEKVKTLDKLMVFNEYLKKDYTDKKRRRGEKLSREDFSAFQELEKQVGWYMYFVYNKNSIENFLLANRCNNSMALVLNHCVVNPALDMQMEEIFWFVKSKRIGINIYCKKSNDKKWKLLKSRVLNH